MQITYLDGPRLKRALIAAGRRVQVYREQLNSINVFPVADSDTGTNMGSTLTAMTKGIIDNSDNSLEAVSRTAADYALSGARGNSGTILSQFFYGLTTGIENQTRINTRAFSEIVRKAVDYTYEALSEPVEGTILTVLRVWSEKLVEKSKKTADFAQLFTESLSSAKEALLDTRRRLPSLKKAKVVDAGALGFVHMIEGIVTFIESGKIRDLEKIPDNEINEIPEVNEVEEELHFRYCTECIIEGSGIEQHKLKQQLSELGDSLIVAGSNTRAKIHIHTDSPEDVFGLARQYGVLAEQKADDMYKQYAAAHSQQSEVALVIDSACDLPPEVMEKSFVHMVPVKVLFGPESYIDKVALSPQSFYGLVRSQGDVVGTTSQPAPADFERVFSFLGKHYRHVLYLSLAGGLSGTIKSAKSALEKVERRDWVHIIDSKNVTIGAGLIARRAVEAIEKGKGITEVKQLVNDLVTRTRLLITIPHLEALLRSGRLGRTKGFIAQLFKLRPLLTLDSQGKVVKAAMVRGPVAGRERLIAMLQRRLGTDAAADFAVAHVDNPSTANWFKEQIERYFKPPREVFILDASPALALHTGFGTSAVAYIDPAEEKQETH
ncbi:MAG: DegV family EDD domain-containing protein [Spirochaetaceae bacterium]|nr:DegV family EDD domain-containing protein [Spirochaetaceae bacterium]MCF7949578.1 DegV family EDD domain-containing protein [Spirochaetia bacterium]MCF7952217.1 DegV family EDD domain-containing protein [Spirochaetaceae bacterium]